MALKGNSCIKTRLWKCRNSKPSRAQKSLPVQTFSLASGRKLCPWKILYKFFPQTSPGLWHRLGSNSVKSGGRNRRVLTILAEAYTISTQGSKKEKEQFRGKGWGKRSYFCPRLPPHWVTAGSTCTSYSESGNSGMARWTGSLLFRLPPPFWCLHPLASHLLAPISSPLHSFSLWPFFLQPQRFWDMTGPLRSKNLSPSPVSAFCYLRKSYLPILTLGLPLCKVC